MNLVTRYAVSTAIAALLTAPLPAADIRVDLSKEQVGKAPVSFEPMVGTWVIAQDGKDKIVMVDGRPWVANKDNPTKLLIQSARKLYPTRLFLAQRVAGRGQNWNVFRILDREWHSWSWNHIRNDGRPMEILAEHLRGLR